MWRNKLILYKKEAEQSVIGSILLHNPAYDDVADILTVDDFYFPEHKICYAAIVHLIHTCKPVDLLTFKNYLQEIGKLEECGGENYIYDLLQDTPTWVNVRTYAELVKKSANDRRLLKAAEKIIGLLEDQHDDRVDIIQQEILSISENNAKEPIHAKEFMQNVFVQLIERADDESRTVGIPTGFNEIDNLIIGLPPSNLILLAARPSMGKTLLALNIIQNALINKKTVLMFSLEMTENEIGNRLLASTAHVMAHKIKRASLLTQEEIERLGRATQALKGSNFVLDDSASVSVFDMRAKARRVKRKYGLDLIVVDYLTLIKENSGKNQNERIGKIARQLKELAKDLKVPVIALSQLNRDVEKRQNRQPILADLRDSGELEQVADIILFIDRPEKYDPNAEKNLANIYVSKNRDGEIGDVKLTFKGAYCCFTNYEPSRLGASNPMQPTKYFLNSFYERSENDA
jgi:replicative DNA helicase